MPESAQSVGAESEPNQEQPEQPEQQEQSQQSGGGDSEDWTPEAADSSAGAERSYSTEEQQLAQAAGEQFNSGDVDGCLSSLRQLAEGHPQDWALRLNRLVAEYQRSGHLRTEEFRQSLLDIARVAGVQLESLDELEDPCHAVLAYNYSLVLFYQRQHTEARRLLLAALPVAEPLGQGFYRRLLLLLLHNLLRLQRPQELLDLLARCEKIVCQPAHRLAEHQEDLRIAKSVAADRAKSELLMFKASALLMQRQLGDGKRLLKELRQLGLSDQPLLFLKSQLHYVRGNYRRALQVAQSIPPSTKLPTDTGECEAAMLWNNLACAHFHLGKHSLGAFYFRRALKENDAACSDYVGRRANGKAQQHQVPLRAFAVSRHCELLHNLGVQLLFAGKPVQAFDHLLEVANVFPGNPRLWLRLAECCVAHQRPSNNADRELRVRQRAVRASVGSGGHRKLLLGNGVQEIKKPWDESAAMPTPTLEFASLCVRNALLLLPREPPAVEQAEEALAAAERTLRWADRLCLPLMPAGCLRGRGLLHFRSSALTLAAYIALCLADHLSALHYCQQLLLQPCLSDCQLYLGRMYMAEAKVHLQAPGHLSESNLADAASLLNPDTVVSVDPLPASEQPPADWPAPKEPSGRRRLINWAPGDALEAQNIMKYNLSVVHAVRGDFDIARQCLQDVVYNPRGLGMTPPFPAHFYFFKLYLDLMQGRRSFAQLLLKETFGHLTPNPSNWRSKTSQSEPPVQTAAHQDASSAP